MVLHTLNCGPGSHAYTDCLRLLAEGDALLLLGDGVYCAAPETQASAALAASGASLYVLADHALARGLDGPTASFTAIDMARFVELTEQCAKQLAWY